MLYIILISIILILVLCIYLIYTNCAKTLNSVDKMLDSAISNKFYETDFTEKKLSKIESKMYRYLSSGKTALRQIDMEKNAIKALIADISHQTKTPISNILLYSQLLSETQGLDKKTCNLVCQIENQTEKLSFLISSLIKTSRLENGIVNVTVQENSVKKLIESLDYKKMADKKGISYNACISSDFKAFFDFKWTLEALSNIVDNAIKYTASNGFVEICAREYEMFICIDISDNGIGISEEETSKIFTRFYRSPRVAEEKGVGIGLYLSREIISKQGGYIKVKSEIGKGSTFSVFLPKQSNLSKL